MVLTCTQVHAIECSTTMLSIVKKRRRATNSRGWATLYVRLHISTMIARSEWGYEDMFAELVMKLSNP